MLDKPKSIASKITRKFVERVNSEEDLKIGEIFSISHKRLKKGRTVTFSSELFFEGKRLGLIYQEGIKTHRECSTYELSLEMPKQVKEVIGDFRENDISNILIIHNDKSCHFDGVSFRGIEIFNKIFKKNGVNLLGNITILPKFVTLNLVYKLYSVIVPTAYGANDMEGCIELVKKIASKSA